MMQVSVLMLRWTCSKITLLVEKCYQGVGLQTGAGGTVSVGRGYLSSVHMRASCVTLYVGQ